LADGFGLRSKLDARIATARRSLFWPALVQAALPALIWFTIFAVFWLTGLYTAMPPECAGDRRRRLLGRFHHRRPDRLESLARARPTMKRGT
jgi:hypothetical protein